MTIEFTGSLQERLQRVLLTPAEATALEVRGAREAGVLVLLYTHDPSHPGVVFTRRRSDLRRHPGEISFPGGRRDPSDGDLLHTALREAHEEIGIDLEAIEVVGALQPTPTIVSGYAVYPFVAVTAAELTWTPSESEVEEVLELPIARLIDGFARRRVIRRGLPIRTDTYLVDDHLIWGATARILGDLLDRLATTG
jgi:8-oxo-dGTP pyrophosphatase MutT (NUDIX family)